MTTRWREGSRFFTGFRLTKIFRRQQYEILLITPWKLPFQTFHQGSSATFGQLPEYSVDSSRHPPHVGGATRRHSCQQGKSEVLKQSTLLLFAKWNDQLTTNSIKFNYLQSIVRNIVFGVVHYEIDSSFCCFFQELSRAKQRSCWHQHELHIYIRKLK